MNNIKEQQDKLWNELSIESQKFIIEKYEKASITIPKEQYELGVLHTYEELYGIHNLNPKLTPKTWEDIDDNVKNIIQVDILETAFKEILDININSRFLRTNLSYKIIATIQISKLIDLGYGGQIKNEEWEDCTIPKYCVFWDCSEDNWFIKEQRVTKSFIAFHKEEQAIEFMSYIDNVELVKNYNER